MIISNYTNPAVHNDENFKLKIYCLAKLNPQDIDEISVYGHITFYDVILSFKDKDDYPFEKLLSIIKSWEEWMKIHDQADDETSDEYYKRVYKYSDELIKKYIEEINKLI